MNEVLGRFHEDTARVRRSFSDYGFMDRVAGWRAFLAALKRVVGLTAPETA